MVNRRYFGLVIAALLVVGFLFASVGTLDDRQSIVSPDAKLSYGKARYTAHAPIRVNSDSELQSLFISLGTLTGALEGLDIDATGAGCGIYIGNCSAVIIRNCNVHGATGNDGTYYWNAGIAIYNTPNTIVENNNVSNNGFGIMINASSNVITKNNTVTGNSAIGIYVMNSGNNRIESNVASSNTGGGIFLASSNNNYIVNNVASSNGADGIHVESANNNFIENNTASSNVGDGIEVKKSNNNHIEFNVANSNYNGIVILDSNTNDVQNNTANSNLNCGFYINGSESNIVSSNTANSNKNGIYIYDSSANTFTGNTADANTEYDINSATNNTNSFTNNNADKTVGINAPPTISLVKPSTGSKFASDKAITFSVTASDPENATLSYRWLDGTVEMSTLQTFTKKLSVGKHNVTIEVSDGSNKASQVVAITITKPASASPGASGALVVGALAIALCCVALAINARARRL